MTKTAQKNREASEKVYISEYKHLPLSLRLVLSETENFARVFNGEFDNNSIVRHNRSLFVRQLLPP